MNAVAIAITVIRMQNVQTPLDHLTAVASWDPLEMDTIVHV